MDYGSIVLKIRQDLSLSQQEMADETGVSQSYINGLEIGRQKKPSLPFITALIKKYKVNPYVFIYDDETQVFRKNNKDETQQLKDKVKKYEKLIEELLKVKAGK